MGRRKLTKAEKITNLLKKHSTVRLILLQDGVPYKVRHLTAKGECRWDCVLAENATEVVKSIKPSDLSTSCFVSKDTAAKKEYFDGAPGTSNAEKVVQAMFSYDDANESSVVDINEVYVGRNRRKVRL